MSITPLDLRTVDAFLPKIRERFYSKVEVRRDLKFEGSFCLLWTGAKCSSGAYGRGSYGNFHVKDLPRGMKGVGAKRKQVLVKAHRYSYELHSGEPIPQDQTVEHRCTNTLCVNFRHLTLKTRAENTAEGNRRRRKRKVA